MLPGGSTATDLTKKKTNKKPTNQLLVCVSMIDKFTAKTVQKKFILLIILLIYGKCKVQKCAAFIRK